MKLVFITDKAVAKTETGKIEPFNSNDFLFTLDNIIKIKNILDKKIGFKVVLLDTTTNLDFKIKSKRITAIAEGLEELLKLKEPIGTIINTCDIKYNTLPKPGNIYEYLLDEEFTLKDSYLIGQEGDVSIKNSTGITDFIVI